MRFMQNHASDLKEHNSHSNHKRVCGVHFFIVHTLIWECTNELQIAQQKKPVIITKSICTFWHLEEKYRSSILNSCKFDKWYQDKDILRIWSRMITQS